MSNHWGYACLTHDPAIVMEELGGVGGRLNHAFDALVTAFPVVRRGEWPMVTEHEGIAFEWEVPAPVVGETGCESAAPIAFLLRHPHCQIAVYDEYGNTWRVWSDGIVVQIAGEDERERETRVRDAQGRATGEMRRGTYPPEGESRCTCIAPVLAVTHPSLNARGKGWVRCETCGGLSLPSEREG